MQKLKYDTCNSHKHDKMMRLKQKLNFVCQHISFAISEYNTLNPPCK
eukprot:UN11259